MVPAARKTLILSLSKDEGRPQATSSLSFTSPSARFTGTATPPGTRGCYNPAAFHRFAAPDGL